MKHVKINAFNCADAWFKTIYTIRTQGEFFKVEHGSEETLTQKLNMTLEIEHPEIRPLIDDTAPTNIQYVNGYALSYLWLSQKEALDDSSYTYGGRLREPVDQIQGIINKYLNAINDRQCTMVTRLPSDIYIEDPPCLSLIDSEIINNKLYLTCYFRSWDAYRALCSNIAGIQLFNEALVKEINEQGNLEISTGKLIFHSKNCHIYESGFKLVDELLNKTTKKIV